MTDNERERKKKWLSSSKWINHRIAFLEREEDRLRLAALPGSVKLDSAPRGSGSNKDLSEYLAMVDKAHSRVLRMKTRHIARRDEITRAVMALNDKEAAVLAFRYLEGRQWEECAHMMGYKDPRSIYPIHGSALEHLEMPLYEDPILYGDGHE